MNTKINFTEGLHRVLSSHSPIIKSLLVIALILTSIQLPLRAQEVLFTKPSWYLGAAVGGNVNFYRGTTQELNADFTTPVAFRKGQGVGLYLAPLVEYHFNDRLGVMLQAGYDGRNNSFETTYTPCNCKADLSTNLTYITFEPSLRFAPFKSNFYIYGGPRLAFNIAKSFTYSQKTNPDFPGQVANADIKGNFSHMNSTLLSMQIGAGYDIPLSSQKQEFQSVLSPFVSFQPYFGQDPRSIETWTVTTVRIGAALKFGRGRLIKEAASTPGAVADATVSFSVHSPENIPVERRVREIFPLRNYVFFDLGSTEIPNRYVLITKDQVKDFKEDQLEVFTPKSLSGRSDREMVVYYNVLNILGDRMGKNPSTIVRLAGASMEGTDEGLAMAESVKKYLTTVFGIDPSRINTEGRIKPRIPSEQPGGTKELDLLREGDHRVSIWSESPELMMEFQSGPDAPLKPIEIVATQTAPLDSYVTFNVDGADEAFSTWRLEVKDEKRQVQYFGPYQNQEFVSIPGKSILGTRPKGDYKVTMIGQTKSGKTVQKEAAVHMVLWTPPKDEEGMRYSVIFEFNESKAIALYDKYLTDIVTPKIPKNGKVIIHGHTDIIGDEAYNQKLSMARANDVKGVIESAVAKAGRTDVTFETYGFGEDQAVSPFDNRYPEERFYNRTVIIDIIPGK